MAPAASSSASSTVVSAPALRDVGVEGGCDASASLNDQWAVVFALVTNYAFRLPKEGQRLVLTENLASHFNLHHGRDTTFVQHVRTKFEEFTAEICKSAVKELRLLEPVSDHGKKGSTDHVIQYRLLHQNLFVILLGLDAGIPNMIVAPPGHSKTFSMTMAAQALSISKGSRDTAFFKEMPHLSSVFHFQGSALSTAEQLMQTYTNAKRKEEAMDDNAKQQSKVLVVIDEACPVCQ